MADFMAMSPDGVRLSGDRFARECAEIAENVQHHRGRVRGMEHFANDRMGTVFAKNYGSSEPVFESAVRLGEWGARIGMSGKAWADAVEQTEDGNQERINGTGP